MKIKNDEEIKNLAAESWDSWKSEDDFEFDGDYYKDGYRNAYSKAQSDLPESARDGFEEWSRNHEYFEDVLDYNETNLASGRPINSADVYSNTEEAWEACSLYHAKLLKEKDERIKELETELKWKAEVCETWFNKYQMQNNQLKEANEVIGFYGNKSSWAKPRNNHAPLFSKAEDDLGDKANNYLSKYGLDKQEREK